jgi:hypothetical protein
MIPLYAVNGNVASLAHNVDLLHIVPQRPQQLEAALVAQCTERLGCLVSAHGIFLFVLQYAPQRRDGSIMSRLTQAVGELMLQQSRWRCESGSNGLDRGDRLRAGWLQACQMLEREKSAKAAGEGLRLRGEDVAKRGNLGILLCDCHFVAVVKKSARKPSWSRKCLPDCGSTLFWRGSKDLVGCQSSI